MSIIALTTGVVLFGSNTALVKGYMNASELGQKILLGNTIGCVFISSLVLFVVLKLYDISYLFSIDNNVFMAALSFSCLNAVITLVLLGFQLNQKPLLYMIVVFCTVLVNVTVSLYFVVVAELGLWGRVYGYLVSGVMVFVGLLIYLKRNNIRITFSLGRYKSFLFFGFPLLCAHLSGWLTEMVDRLMVAKMLGLEETGIYSAGYRFGMLILVLQSALSRAWLPYMFRIAKTNKREVLHKSSVVSCMMLLVTAIYSGIVYVSFDWLVGDKYIAGRDVAVIICSAYFLDGIWKIFNSYLIFDGKTRVYSSLAIFSGLMNVVLNFFLIEEYGYIGAAWATFFSMLIGLVATVLYLYACTSWFKTTGWFNR